MKIAKIVKRRQGTHNAFKKRRRGISTPRRYKKFLGDRKKKKN